MKKFISAVWSIACVCVATSAFAAGGEPQWKRVQRMDPGTRITVTMTGAAPVERRFVQLSDSELVVLNLSAPDLPKGQLIEMAKGNPAWMAGTAKTIYRDNNVRVGPDGVFVKDKKVANLGEVVEHIPRANVTAIKS